MFYFPGFFILPDHIISKEEFLSNLSIFNPSNYNNIFDMKNSQLHNYIFCFVSNVEDIHRICSFCDKQYVDEILGFVNFLLNPRDFEINNIDDIKNYNISYEALNEFTNIIAWYIRNSMY